MKPDLDDYEDLNSEETAPRGRAMSWLVLGVAVVGFGALAYYAYQSGSQSAADGQMLMVEAEQGAIKETPADAGGEQFPNKDKTIYDALSPYRTEEEKVEKLLPEPEEPVIPEPAVSTAPEPKKTESTTTFVNDGVSEKAKAEVEDGRTAPAPTAAPLESVTVEDAPVATKTVAATAPITPLKKPEPVSAPAPKAEPKAQPVAKPVEPKPTPAPVVKKAEAPKPAAAPTGGSYKIQLAALGSDAEARQTWSKITAKHGDVVKGSPIIIKAEVNGKTYYRLRATGFSSAAAAKSACATLSSRGQGCMSVGQ